MLYDGEALHLGLVRKFIVKLVSSGAGALVGKCHQFYGFRSPQDEHGILGPGEDLVQSKYHEGPQKFQNFPRSGAIILFTEKDPEPLSANLFLFTL